ncbi:OmpP1/FadL family transporter [Tropicibacter oceani]|uniref:Outer membrane protein transport protein n=1 Tax=Tropicibacter oceani TaxID=3058420 RepID=A0ABY8QDT3_9RHOB|nr:outer membrane protein transport protein [Tropicibacter oceani]WGW02665.1 outer membrane protein transport protein [Tropicibacter oceani]
MNKTLFGAAALTLTATTAISGGIERSVIDYGLMFQPGTQMTLGHALVTPRVSGKYTAATGGGDTGNMANSYGTFSFAYKNDLSDKLAFGLYHNQPYGAGASYTSGFYTGLSADWTSKQTAAVLKYKIGDRFSVFGGLRYVLSSADIVIPDQMIRASTAVRVAETQSQIQAGITQLQNAGAPATDPRLVTLQTQLAQTNAYGAAVAAAPAGSFQYTAQGEQRGDWGFVVGAAYEIPDIALRVGLTWESKVTHKFDTTESLPFFGIPGNSETEVEMPQSVALDFQTGIAEGTLLFGGVKWTEWSKWEVRTPGYESVTGTAVTGFANDVITYRVGLGKKFNDNYSAFAQIGYEASDGEVASRLSPTDGRTSFGVGAQFTEGAHKLRIGMEYVKLGDAKDASGTKFEGNSAIGFGMAYTASF